MRFLIQRVKDLKIENLEIKEPCLLIYVGIEKNDENKDLKEIVNYLENLQIIEENDKFSQTIKNLRPNLVFVSQITLLANFDKNGRINFNQSLEQNKARKIFEDFIKIWRSLNYNIYNLEFGSYLLIESTNIGPVNFIIEL
jgi:D-tyrosyl-tRNA(Tyr) deacylase